MKKWNSDHKSWVEKHRYSFNTYEEMRIAFNKHFNTNATRHALIGILRRGGGSACICKDKNWITQEQIEWLKSRWGKEKNSLELLDEFNKTFNTHYKGSALVGIANKHGIKMDKKDRCAFIGRETQKNQSVPIGSEYVDNGYVYIKIHDYKQLGKRNFRDNWTLKQRYIWEQHYGEVPKGYIISFYDGNTQNCDIDNLFILTPKEKLHLQTLGWLGQKELTIAGLEVIRTEQVLVNKGIIKRQKSDINRLRDYRRRKRYES